MKINIPLIMNELKIVPKQKEYGDLEGILHLKGWRLYCGEKLKGGILYLTDIGNLQRPIEGDRTAGLIITGKGDNAGALQKIHADCPWAQLEEEDIFTFCNRVNELFEKYREMDKSLHDAVYTGESLQTMVDIFSPFIHNEMILMNSEFYLLAHTYDKIRLYEMSGLDPYVPSGRIPKENLDFFKNDIIYSEVRDEKEPFIYSSSIYAVDVLCMNVFYQGDFVCRVVICEVDTEFRPYDRELLRYFTGFVQLIYDLRGQNLPRQESDSLSEILLKLMNQENVESWRLKRSMEQHKWKEQGPFLCACLQPSSRDYYNNTVSYYCQLIFQNYPMTCSFEYDRCIVCLVNLSQCNNSEKDFLAQFVYFLRDSYFQAGFSNCFTDILSLRSYYMQAVIALNMGLESEPTMWYHRFSDKVMEYLRDRMCGELAPQFLCAGEVLVLQKHDAENQTAYFQTLKVYLEENMNAVATAEKLYIHRATMMYRLKRIKELADIDFKNPKQVLYLNLSCQLLS